MIILEVIPGPEFLILSIEKPMSFIMFINKKNGQGNWSFVCFFLLLLCFVSTRKSSNFDILPTVYIDFYEDKFLNWLVFVHNDMNERHQ